MIISAIIGGLGNQMFQYAAGRALALAKKQVLKIDTRAFRDYGLHHGFQLHEAFNGHFAIASDLEIKALLGWQDAPLIQRILSRPSMTPFRKSSLVMEPHFQYWPSIRNVPDDSYTMGYWQSERYFLPHAAEIRADFSFKSPLARSNIAFAEEIRRLNSVSLHVRRGDYVSNPVTAATHGQCTLAYYQAAARHVLERVNNPVFFVFSDDMLWVRKHLALPAPMEYIDHNQQAFDDMHLMSLCKHHVIANSSFSWWGAWLNPNPNKIVVAPRQWFAVARNTQDLLPAAWVAL